MRRKKKDDLERYKDVTVASMNVEGMPWYGKKPGDAAAPGGLSANRATPEACGGLPGNGAAQEASGGLPGNAVVPEPPGLRETWRLIGRSLVLVLLLGGVFFFFFFLLLLFMTKVWL